MIEQILDFRFDPLEPRGPHGEWEKAGSTIEKVVEPIGQEGARGNSRAVSHAEFQQLAAEGRTRLREIQARPWSTAGMDRDWAQVKARAYAEVQKSWGGATIDPRTGEELPQGADKFAMSIKPHGLDTTSISEHAGAATFDEAMNVAQAKYHNQLSKGGSYLGVFHDDDLHRIDIDPVTVLDSLREVETIGAYTHAIGGAYRFSDGNGYWPPHVAEGAGMSNPDTHFAGPGQWHSQAVAIQEPHDEPEDGEDGEEPVGLAAQLLDFAPHFNPLEKRDAHGRWTRSIQVGETVRNTRNGRIGTIISRNAPIGGHVYAVQVRYDEDGKRPRTQSIVTEKLEPHERTEQLTGRHFLRALADPLIGAPIPREDELRAASVAEAARAAPVVDGLVSHGSGSHEIWDGRATIYRQEAKPHILAELDWNGHMNVADDVAAALEEARAHPDQPVRAPDAFEVIEHEMIHGVVPPGSEEANRKAYQDYATAQIEEGFTELGATQHGPEFMQQMGLADRESGIWKGHTVGEMAEEMRNPVEISTGHAWGHYPQQTKDAQDWVQLIAKEEGHDTDARAAELADQVNQQGAAGKVHAMASQLVATMAAKHPKLAQDPAFIPDLTNQVEQSIRQQWSVGAAREAFNGAKAVAIQRVAEKEREMAESAA